MATLVKGALLVSLVLPGALVGAAAWLWWSGLARPWLFVGVGSLALYSFAIYLMTRQLNRGRVAQGGLAGEARVTLFVFLAVAGATLWLLRKVLALHA